MKANVKKMIRSNKRKIAFYAIMSFILMGVLIISMLSICEDLAPEYDTLLNNFIKIVVCGVLALISFFGACFCSSKIYEGEAVNRRLTKYMNSIK